MKRRINSLNTTLRRRREQIHSSASATTSPDAHHIRDAADFFSAVPPFRPYDASSPASFAVAGGDAASRHFAGVGLAARPDVRRVFSPEGSSTTHPALATSSASFTYGATAISSSPSSSSGSPSVTAGGGGAGGGGSGAFRRGATLDSAFGGGLPFLQNKSGHYEIHQPDGRSNNSNGDVEEGIKTISLTPTGTTPRCRVDGGRRNSPSAAEIFGSTAVSNKGNGGRSNNNNDVDDDDHLDHDSPERTPDAKLEFGYATPPAPPHGTVLSPTIKDSQSSGRVNYTKDASSHVGKINAEGVNDARIISPPAISPAEFAPNKTLHQQQQLLQQQLQQQLQSQQRDVQSQRSPLNQPAPPPPQQQQQQHTQPPSRPQQQQQPLAQPALDDDLPNYVLVRDELGVTQINDLSSADLARIRSLSLIELTALFDVLDIQFNKRKPLKPRGLPKPGESPSRYV